MVNIYNIKKLHIGGNYKMNCKNKSFMTKKKAFTLIELLIVIAIIGILFIVLISKVDFATDKAKTTGVQTDFRSFQSAFDTVAKENAGFNTFGWDTGDLNANGKRDSYDEGDANKDGIRDTGEVWTGHKVYAETFTKVFSLKKAKADGTLETNYDRDALNRLETAINANLDPKLHITIKDDGEIVMANGAKDPWKKEYHGWYITNAEVDGKDRGAIVMYSDGANNKFGSEHKIANGVVSITVPGNNVYGKDDYAMSTFYTFANGIGEVAIITTGFSNNQKFLGVVPEYELDVIVPEAGNENVFDESKLIDFTIGKFEANTSFTPGQYTTVEYEVTKIREKKPVANSQIIQFTGYPDTVNLETLNPFLSTYESEYIVYSCYKASSSNSNGYIEVHCNQRTINNPSDDTLENAIYLAACVQKSVSEANGGRYYPYHIAKWNGSEYVKVDYRAQIDAITDFTETYTETATKQVMISLPSSNTNYVYIPSGTMQAEQGMTWQEWINSPYNTLGFNITSVWNSDYEEIDLSTPISAHQSYGFKNDESSLTLNEYGFYFNQPYRGEIDGMIIEFIFYENCSVSGWGIENGVYVTGVALPAGISTYYEKTIIIEETGTFMVSDDGKKLTNYDGIELILSPVKQSSLMFNSVYEYEAAGLGIVVGSDYSLTIFENGEIYDQQPANSVNVENNSFNMYVDGNLIQVVIYPDGSRMCFGNFVLESTGLRLNTPVIQLRNDIVQIEPVLGATAYEIYVDNVLVGTTTTTTFNVSGMVDTIGGSYVAVKAINTEMSAASKFAWQWRAGIEIEPGLYSSNNTLLASWGKLVYDLHLDIERDYSDGNDNNNPLGHPSSPYSILNQNFNGLTDLKLIVGFGSRIGANVFNYCEITTIEIPNSIVDIDFTAFRWNYELEWIEIEENHPLYVSIGGIVYNKSITEIVCVPNNISGTVELPDGITEIRDSEFSGRENMKSIVIPNSVTKIGSSAFSGATSLLEIRISKYVTEIGNNPFANASSLSSIIVDPDNPKYHSDGNCLIETSTKTLISGCRNSTIPADGSVTIIGRSAFLNVLKGTSIVLPNTIIRIEASAFQSNQSLKSITLSNNLEYIGQGAFSNTQIYNFTIPASVKYISNGALTYRVSSITFENPNGWYKANDEKGTGMVAININSLTPSQIQSSYLFHD